MYIYTKEKRITKEVVHGVSDVNMSLKMCVCIFKKNRTTKEVVYGVSDVNESLKIYVYL